MSCLGEWPRWKGRPRWGGSVQPSRFRAPLVESSLQVPDCSAPAIGSTFRRGAHLEARFPLTSARAQHAGCNVPHCGPPGLPVSPLGCCMRRLCHTPPGLSWLRATQHTLPLLQAAAAHVLPGGDARRPGGWPERWAGWQGWRQPVVAAARCTALQFLQMSASLHME